MNNNSINEPIYYNNFKNSNKKMDISSILNFNKGKKVSIYQCFQNSEEIKVFKGIIELSEKGYVILSDPNTGKWNILLIAYINYIEFDEEVNIS